MKKIYCIISGKYRKLKKTKIWYLLEKTVPSTICSKCKNEDEKIFKEESVEILKFFVFIENI